MRDAAGEFCVLEDNLRIPSSVSTIQGPQRANVIYRRIDCDFLDPLQLVVRGVVETADA